MINIISKPIEFETEFKKNGVYMWFFVILNRNYFPSF